LCAIASALAAPASTRGSGTPGRAAAQGSRAKGCGHGRSQSAAHYKCKQWEQQWADTDTEEDVNFRPNDEEHILCLGCVYVEGACTADKVS